MTPKQAVTKNSQALAKPVNMRLVLLLRGIGFLLLAYAFGSWAIDTANYWQYLATIFCLVFGIKYLIRLFKTRGKGR